MYQITPSFSFLENVLVLLQTSEVLKVRSFLSQSQQTKLSSLCTYIAAGQFIAVQCQSILQLKKQQGFHTSYDCKLLFTSLFRLLTQLILLSRNHHLYRIVLQHRRLKWSHSARTFRLPSLNMNTKSGSNLSPCI